jgi:membrane-bound metal-dependent hydrolase YbcI (DUF457 family)
VGFVSGLCGADVYEHVTSHHLSAGLTVLCALLAAGGALLNDLDSHSSTASSSAGPITDLVGKGVRGASRISFDLTASHADHAHTKGTHRGLSHTGLFVPLIGFALDGLCQWLGFAGTLGVVFVVLFLAARGLPPKNSHVTDVILAVAGTVVAWYILPTAPTTVLVAGAVALGVASHTVLDATTTNGCPIFAPLPLGNQRWRHVGTPRFLRYRTGGGMEMCVFGLAIVASVLLLPGVWPTAVAAINNARGQ